VAIGAILTQRTSWDNVLLAIRNLKVANSLDPASIVGHEDSELEEIIRPSGFFRQKSRYVKEFSQHVLSDYSGDIEKMRDRPTDELRKELLSLKGIGPETADTILLYALGLPSFVVDSYSFRLLRRLGIYDGKDYAVVKDMFERLEGMDARRMSVVHAAIVNHCKTRCRKTPECDGCPLTDYCPSEAHQNGQ
jgi:endonuclease-3 related protein